MMKISYPRTFFKYGLVISFLWGVAIAQPKITAHNQVLWTSNDSFTVRFSAFPGELSWYSVTQGDTIDLGNNVPNGSYAVVSVGKDSVLFIFRNAPFAQHHLIRIHSQAGKTVFQLRFNQSVVMFSKHYMKTRKGAAIFEIPEVFELANIVWALSPAGRAATNLYTEGSYYRSLLAHFKPYLNHPVFKRLQFGEAEYMNAYYDFRDNSLAFTFKGDKLSFSGPYYYVSGNDYWTFNSLFKQLVPLLEDFARKSGFRNFYRKKQNYYKRLLQEQQQLLPVKQMWSWLEKEFPDRKYSAYKIIFSPLIGSSHSTQQFWDAEAYHQFFSEVIMFVPGPSKWHTIKTLTSLQRQALASGTLFTEIDHNYVNPESSQYESQIDSLFMQWDRWAEPTASYYSTRLDVFNEYMTHALFCLYATEVYNADIANLVIKEREALMKQRGFPRFTEFTAVLFKVRKQHKEKTIKQLYPILIETLL
jgi:hypothetical protein